MVTILKVPTHLLRFPKLHIKTVQSTIVLQHFQVAKWSNKNTSYVSEVFIWKFCSRNFWYLASFFAMMLVQSQFVQTPDRILCNNLLLQSWRSIINKRHAWGRDMLLRGNPVMQLSSSRKCEPVWTIRSFDNNDKNVFVCFFFF